MSRKSTNIAGKKYGCLTAVSLHKKLKGVHYWNCICECGAPYVLRKGNLTFYYLATCRECRRRPVRENPYTKKTYNAWTQMKQRCYNPNRAGYKNHHKNGITVCPEWKNHFDQFHYDMGSKPDGKILARIDPLLGYNKNNCSWATTKGIARWKNFMKWIGGVA